MKGEIRESDDIEAKLEEINKVIGETSYGVTGAEAYLTTRDGKIATWFSLTNHDEWHLNEFRAACSQANRMGEELSRKFGVEFLPADAEKIIEDDLKEREESGK